MRRSQVIPLGAALALVLSVGTGFLAARQASEPTGVPATPAQVAAGDWGPSIAGCVPDIPVRNGETYAQAGVRDCLVDVMVQAYLSGDTAAFADELQIAVDADQTLYETCHPAAHEAGIKALAAIRKPAAALDAVAESTVCDWGMGHGLLDALSEQGPSDEDLLSVVSWCDSHPDDMRLYSMCTDGLGHLFWGARETLSESVVLCERVATSAGREACGGGILMQIFQPAARGATLPLSEAPARMPKLCAEWGALVTADGALKGCYTGAGYLFSLPIKERMHEWWNSADYQPAASPPTERLTPILEALRLSIAACGTLNAGASGCYDSLAGNTPSRFAKDHPAGLDVFCREFPSDTSQRSCLLASARPQG